LLLLLADVIRRGGEEERVTAGAAGIFAEAAARADE
jgi:hypothetical protein